MKTIFDLNLLNSFINEHCVEIVGDYDKLTRESIINGKCKNENCDGEFRKTFRMLFKNKGFYCKTCQNKNTQQKLKATNLIKYGCEYNLDNEEVKQKRTNTFLEKYGGHPSSNENIKQKKKETYIERYGVEHITKLKTFKDKKKEMCLLKYGVEHQMKLESVKQKMKRTNMMKYGTECSLHSEIIQNKMKEDNLIKYGYEYPSQNLSIKNKVKYNNILKYGVEYPAQNSEIAEKMSAKAVHVNC